MKNPVLYVFAISHYCEKARWIRNIYRDYRKLPESASFQAY